ncbi:OmpA family protein [Pseudorhodobacter sp.]|jgi:outer membrane protein OmpA-like peptidoglycan-associated protein|uniref:OmpA family protein n=1 Tax=Pseudorhodobacter sp. TaxID=1934400 RepID=UPI002AFE9BF8|nr:OmpA family protein [Pseudorhodobacter sp.]
MRISTLFLSVSLLALGACGPEFGREAGADNTDNFGNATMNNTLIHSGQKDYTIALAKRFSSEVPPTITFAFNSAQLDRSAIDILRLQADWIKTFPEARFRVYGHTDLVGSSAYNKALGLRRAQAVVAYFASQGISRNRLEALASFGETRPVVQTLAPEQRNRRTVTEVSGFVQNHPTVLNGKYAQVIFREYLDLAKRPHPPNQVIATQTNPGQ